jgi:hypothetical protein
VRLALLGFIFLAGCTTAKVTRGPDGREAHSINCSGTANSWNACYEKAGELCGARGYDVVDKTGDTGSTFNAGAGWATGTSFATRTLLVSCR